MTPGELQERLNKNPDDLEKLRLAHDCRWNVDGFVEAVRDPAQEWKICEFLGVPTEVDRAGQAAQAQFFVTLTVGLVTLLVTALACSAALFRS